MERERVWIMNDKYGGAHQAPPDEMRRDMARLAAGEPVDYIIGWREFLGVKIDLSVRPLIPRAETEFWVERAIQDMRRRHADKAIRILDLFSGSGAIGVACLKHIPSAHVDFADIDRDCLRQIAVNARALSGAAGRYRIIESSVFGDISGQYDYIFANPPYLDRKKTEHIQPAVLAYEPHRALFADQAGFALIQKTITGAAEHLTEDGILYLEFDTEQETRIRGLTRSLPFSLAILNDQYAKPRAAALMKHF